MTGVGSALAFLAGSDMLRAERGSPLAQGIYGGALADYREADRAIVRRLQLDEDSTEDSTEPQVGHR